MEALVVVSWLVAALAVLLKLVLSARFRAAKFPGAKSVGLFWGGFLTWDDAKMLRQEYKAFLTHEGLLAYNRMLSAALILGGLGFVLFGYLADASLPKHRKGLQENTGVSLSQGKER